MTSHTYGAAMPLADRVLSGGLLSPPEPAGSQTVDVPPSTVEALRAALLAGETHYTSRPGMPALRARLGEALTWLGGPGYDSGTGIVITSGARESLFVTLLGLRPPPGPVLVSADTALYASLFHLMHLVPTGEVPSEPAGLRLLYRGRETSYAQHRTILSLGEAHRLVDVLNVGEAVGRDPRGSLPPVSAERTVVIGSLDGLPGVRAFGAGFAAGPPALIARIRVWKQAFSICTAAPSQRAALVAIDAWLKEAQ